MTQKWIDRLTALFVASTALVVVLACGSSDLGSSDLGSSNSNSNSNSNEASTEPAVQVDAATILADYEGNEVAADNKYKGKVVEVKGIVADIGKDLLDDIYVTVGTGADFEIPQVQCFVTKDMEQKAGTLKKGQAITVKGKVDSLMMNVMLKNCSF